MRIKNEYTAIIKQEGDWYVGWIEEVPGVNCQEKNIEALKRTLKVALKEVLAFNRQDAIALAGDTYQEEKIAVLM